MKNIAIIPVRLGSKRLPDKNIKTFMGKPLFIYTVESAYKSGLFDKIHISTESLKVKSIAEHHGFQIDFMRPKELASSQAKLKDVCRYVLDKYLDQGSEFENLCLLWATSPMRTHEDILSSFELISNNIDSVIGVSEYNYAIHCAQEIKEGLLRPVFPDKISLRSDQLPRVVCDNSSLCWITIDKFRENNDWLVANSAPYMMSIVKSIDIETNDDWELAEYYFKKYYDET